MTSNSEIIDIPCPYCERIHSYNLLVEHSVIVSLARRYKPEQRWIRITRLFTCPKEHEDFEATFELLETDDDRINSVVINNFEDANDRKDRRCTK